MLRDITIGQHFPGNSLVHRFDPRLKLVLTIVYIVMLFAASNPLGLTLSILFLAVMYRVAKIPLKMIGKSLKPILPIVIFTAVLNLFFVSGEGEPLVHIWFLTIYAEGVRYAVLMAVRVMALIAGTSLLTYTTSPIVLTDAIEQLLKPLGKLHFPGKCFCPERRQHEICRCDLPSIAPWNRGQSRNGRTRPCRRCSPCYGGDLLHRSIAALRREYSATAHTPAAHRA